MLDLNQYVPTIGSYAFANCTGLTSVTLPRWVTTVYEGAFSVCTNLTEINISIYNDYYASVGGILFNKNQTTIHTCPAGLSGAYTIPSTVTAISRYCFEGCSGLTAVTIPTSVKTINGYAFSGCTGLTSITISTSVKTINSAVFTDCTGLTSITIPGSVTTIGTMLFSDCTGLTSATLPGSITTLTNGIFSGCSALEKIVIPSSITKIDGSAFCDCTGLKYVIFQGSAPTISSSSFARVTATCLYSPNTSWGTSYMTNYGGTLTWAKGGDCGDNLIWMLDGSVLSICGTGKMYSKSSSSAWGWYNYRSTITDVLLDPGITSIGNYAFYGFSALTEISLPDTLTSIGSYAFSGCSGLTGIVIPDSVTGATYSYTMTAAKSGRHAYCVISDANGNTIASEVVTLRMG